MLKTALRWILGALLLVTGIRGVITFSVTPADHLFNLFGGMFTAVLGYLLLTIKPE